MHAGENSIGARTPASPPRPRRRRPGNRSSAPASPPRPRRRHATRTRRGCVAARTSTPAGSGSPDATESELVQGGAAKKKAAADVYLGQAERDDWFDLVLLTIELGPRYWAQEFVDWLYMMRGCARDRIKDEWTWIGVVGHPIEQHDNSCVISSTLVCLEARHRLDFERRHGFKTFPFRIPAATVRFFKERCKRRGVWNEKVGGHEDGVLDVIQRVGGAFAAKVPGWKLCKLQVKSWEFHHWSDMPPSELAKLMYAEGPLLGTLITGTDYYEDGWEDRVYRGAPRSQKGAGPHLVVCLAYRYGTIGQPPHGIPELQIEVMDNQRQSGPVRWIAASAFTLFCEVHVEPLDVNELQLKKPCWWRRLLSTVRGIFAWIFRR